MTTTHHQPRQRVAVTGIGVLCPLGHSAAELSESLFRGRSGLKPLALPHRHGQIETLAGVVSSEFPDLDAKQKRRLDRCSLLALQAACDAVRDARLAAPLAATSGVFVGSGFGGIATLLEQASVLDSRGPGRVSPFLVPAAIANAAAGYIAERFVVTGPNLTTVTACAAGANAIGEAWLRLQRGEISLAIAGGCEAPLTALAIAGFQNMRALAPAHVGCRPFAADRAGFAMGEGAAMLVLEPWQAALERRATIYAELSGYAVSADAHHITDPDPQGRGAETAVRQALRQAGITPEMVDYVNAHGTGTPAGDIAEAQMLARVFYREPRPWVSSSKGQLGHLLGAAGAVEAVISVLALQSGILPANLPVAQPDPACPLRLVQQPGQQAPLRHVISNSFGFGGVNAVLVFSRADLGVKPG